MKLAIHSNKDSFAPYWIAYCESRSIPFKLVNCYANNIIEQLGDCSALMWHHHQSSSKDILFAKQLLFSLQQAGINVFPDFNSGWHFDDKVGQKYLLEALNAPLVPTYVFYSEKEALDWSGKTAFPKVFKLRGGAGSSNVRLVKTKKQACKIIKTAFGKGFKQYDAFSNLKERYRKYKLGKTSFRELIKGVVRLGYEPRFSKVMGRERGYVYFQEFVPANDSDIRIIVINGKAFAMKRMVRENDFRASGSGFFKYAKEEFDERCVSISFETAQKMKASCIAFDYIFDKENNPLIVEISYGFVKEVYDACEGYWDEQLKWHETKFDPTAWMIEGILKTIES